MEFKEPAGAKGMIPLGVFGPEAVSMIELNLSKLDSDWKNDQFDYVGQGKPERDESKIEYYQCAFVNKSTVDAPILYFPNVQSPLLTFVDGRHRTIVCLENGVKSIPFVVPAEQAELFLSKYG